VLPLQSQRSVRRIDKVRARKRDNLESVQEHVAFECRSVRVFDVSELQKLFEFPEKFREGLLSYAIFKVVELLEGLLHVV
jgi:16S rRNA U1498 N3-methylase RsmE